MPAKGPPVVSPSSASASMAAIRKLGTTAETVISVPQCGHTKVMSARSASRRTTVSMSSSETVIGPSIGHVIVNSMAPISLRKPALLIVPPL